MQLVIVESPAKAKTIEKYLGGDYKVLASYGHVRDLPPKDGSVDPDDDFAMKWQPYGDKAKQLKAISDLAKKADRLILATDPDREGEAISWHVMEVLKAKKLLPADVQRVTFNAITKSAVTEAMARPRALDIDLIEAYLARRALDYLVGFTLSPVLWRKLPGAKSAGRVQSVALRLIVERERDIEAFKSDEYWSVTAQLEHKGQSFQSRLTHYKGEKLEKLSLGNEAAAQGAFDAVDAASLIIDSVETKPTTRNPQPPFTTSTLQQEAARKLGFAASHTMRIAQQLYEDGSITYMRTDGVQMDPSAISEARKAISDRYDGGYIPDKPRIYKSKAKNAQEAHEAIRPTNFSKDKAGSGDHGKLYDLIFKRAMASQMAAARLERTAVDFVDGTGQLTMRANGQIVKFPGFMALYEEGRDDSEGDDGALLPPMIVGEKPVKKLIEKHQHFTQPAPRYSEASLVKRLEELGIGRPSTYAATLQVLKDRNYVRIEQKRFFAEESGRLLTAFLERFFERYVAYEFTAALEDKLDEVSDGKAEYKKVLSEFWSDFKPKTAEVMEQKPSDITAELDKFLSPYLFPENEDGSDPRTCPKCDDGKLALRGGRFGAFVACNNYPECKFTRKFGQAGASGDEGGEDIELGKHPQSDLTIMRKSGRFGPYVQMGEGKEAKRASIPKDILAEDFGLEWALKLLSLPRMIGEHPETSKEISAAIGRYGPYLLHNGKYAKLDSTDDVFEIGMNAAVAKIADALNNPGRGRAKAEPLKILGKHPRSDDEIKLMDGRYGAYVTDGNVNATIPKSIEKDQLTLEEAAQLIDERAAKGPAKKRKKAAPKKKAAVKKATPKKPAAKKPAAKKAPAKKTVAKKAAPKKDVE